MLVQQHVYQKTHNGEIIFYSSRDAIVFFTTFCAVARKHGVAPVALCIMPEHLHGLYKADCRGDLSPFIKEYSRIFTLQFNKDISRRGSLFKPRFGCAAKAGSKSIRTINAYIANNPVEKRSCLRAEEYRWNFLAYAVSDHPFSDKLIIRKAGSNMKKAVRVVDYLRNRNQREAWNRGKNATHRLHHFLLQHVGLHCVAFLLQILRRHARGIRQHQRG